MTTVISPEKFNTRSGAPLPLVALPQDGLLTINSEQIPILKDAIGPGISIRPLRLDAELGETVLLATLAPGCVLPVHYHTGPAEVYTFSGRWAYREYPYQPQTAGCYLYEPGGSVHTFYCPEDNTEDTIVLLWMRGAQIGFNEDGTFHSITDAVSLHHLTETLSVARGIGPVGYIHGGSADVIKSS